MSVVYKALDVNLDRLVALKILPPHFAFEEENKERIIREAKAIAALDHPNICAVYEIGESDNQIFIAMAYYEGETLKEKVSRSQFSVNSVIDFASQIAAGLAHAHKAGIIHRDVKPSNIIITKQGEAKIIDFGMSKILGQEGLTRDGAIVGTAEYI